MAGTGSTAAAPPRWREVFAGTLTIRQGLAGAFAIGIVAPVLLAFVARRLPDARASELR